MPSSNDPTFLYNQIRQPPRSSYHCSSETTPISNFKEQLEKHRAKHAAAAEEPLRAIVRFLVTNHESFPPVKVRQKHYRLEGSLRNEINEQAQTDVINGVQNSATFFNLIMQIRHSSMESDARTKERKHQAELLTGSRYFRSSQPLTHMAMIIRDIVSISSLARACKLPAHASYL